MNDETEMTWKEVVVTLFKVLYRHLPERTEENLKTLRIMKC
jgi:hypothetical protein